MKKFYGLLSLILAFLLTSISVNAEIVYSSGGVTTYEKYINRGYVSHIQNPEFDVISSLGMVTAVYVDFVYGENPAVASATEDVWDGGTTYAFSADATADIRSIATSDASGDEDIIIKGLNVTGDLVSQTATLNGTTRVALTTPLWRFLNAENDETSDLAGNVFIYTGTSTIPSLGGATVRGVILSGENKSYSSIYTVPNDKIGLILSTRARINQKGSTSAAASSTVNLVSRKYGKSFKKLDSSNLSIGVAGYQNDSVLAVLPGLSDIKYSITDATGDSVGIVGSYKIMIFDETRFDDDFLTGIGQPGY